MAVETPVLLDCHGEQLLGILHEAEQHTGVLIVVGGPQYRVGSHRQFVLLARHLAQQGLPCLRFDVRGMGDSTGQARDFSQIQDDIRAAIDGWLQLRPQIERIVIWGLCDAASAACQYAYQDARVQGLVLLNPWVFTEQGSAKTYLKHYYRQRLLSPDLWRKVFSLNFDIRDSWHSLCGLVQRAGNKPASQTLQLSLPQKMLAGLQQFPHPLSIILSGRDLVADEFRELVKNNSDWQALMQQTHISLHTLEAADHTFSKAQWRDQVAEWTAQWIRAL